MDFDNLSNNELKIKIKSLNDEFEAVKSDVSKKVKYMEELSKNYDTDTQRAELRYLNK